MKGESLGSFGQSSNVIKIAFKWIKERLHKGLNSQVSRLEVGKSVRRLLQISRLEMLVAPTTEVLEWGNWE